MDGGEVTKYILVIILIIVAVFAAGKIYAANKAFLSIGEPENSSLTELKQTCNDKPDAECALQVAQKNLEEGGNNLETQSFLKRSIEGTTDQKLLNDIFVFARDSFYSKNKDYAGAAETYAMLYAKLKTPEVKLQLDSSQVSANLVVLKGNYAALEASYAGQLETSSQLKALQAASAAVQQMLHNTMQVYQQNTDIGDSIILGDPKDENVCLREFVKVGQSAVQCDRSLRASIVYGCFADAVPFIEDSYNCNSCYYYSRKDQVTACSGYDNQYACEDDPCGEGHCVWQGGCKSINPNVVASSDEPQLVQGS